MQVKSLMSCWNCEVDLSASLDDDGVVECPSCKSLNGPGVAKKFEDPVYVSEQMNRLKSAEGWIEFTKNRPAHKVIACAAETLDTLSIITQKPMTSEDMREFIGICISIGKLAQALENSFAAGAIFNGKKEDSPSASNTQDEIVYQGTTSKIRSKTKRGKSTVSRM